MKKPIRAILNGLRFGILPGGTGVPIIGHARMVASSRKGIPVRTGHAASLLLRSLIFLLPTAAQAQFTFATNNGALTITSYTGNATTLSIPSTTNGHSVTGIGSGAFIRMSSLTNVSIPESVVTIGDSAFASCFGLASINIPDSITYIGSRAFDGCKLTSINIPQYVTNIGYQAFSECQSLTGITVDGQNLFYSDMNGVLFNKSHTALIQCPAQKAGSYAVTDSVTIIGDEAFFGSSLRSIHLPVGVTSIGLSAFYWCTNLTTINIPDSVTNIGIQAFSHCTSMTNITIGNSVNSIGGEAFSHCHSLTNITIGESVTTIEESVFYGCSGLTQVTIPDGVTNIGMQAFLGCSGLRSVRIGNGVTAIGDAAFLHCVSMTGVFCESNAPSVGAWVFFDYGRATVFYLPGTTGWGTNFGALPTALWKPKILTGDASFGVQTNQFGFSISWASGMAVAVDACTNPANPVWTPLQTNMLTSDMLYFSDPQWTNHPARFYRLRWP
jgi:hypothetical protein